MDNQATTTQGSTVNYVDVLIKSYPLEAQIPTLAHEDAFKIAQALVRLGLEITIKKSSF